MKFSLDTNVIISHFKADKFSDDTDRFFAWIKNFGHKIYIADIVYAELYAKHLLKDKKKL
jgi:predicted nucleic acid-binding protein